jgi:hypothetical protein
MKRFKSVFYSIQIRDETLKERGEMDKQAFYPAATFLLLRSIDRWESRLSTPLQSRDAYVGFHPCCCQGIEVSRLSSPKR